MRARRRRTIARSVPTSSRDARIRSSISPTSRGSVRRRQSEISGYGLVAVARTSFSHFAFFGDGTPTFLTLGRLGRSRRTRNSAAGSVASRGRYALPEILHAVELEHL